jgi:hypothetical protein
MTGMEKGIFQVDEYQLPAKSGHRRFGIE